MDRRVLLERRRRKKRQMMIRRYTKLGIYVLGVILAAVFLIRGIILPIVPVNQNAATKARSNIGYSI